MSKPNASSTGRRGSQTVDGGDVIAGPARATAARVTVNLTARSLTALAKIADLTDDSKTNAINKALQAYARIQEAQHNGGHTIIQDSRDDTPVRVEFL